MAEREALHVQARPGQAWLTWFTQTFGLCWVCMSESVVPRDFIDLGINTLRFVTS